VPLPPDQATRYRRLFLSGSGRPRLRASVLAALIVGCGGGTDLLLPGDGEPATIEVTEGNNQSGRVGEPLNDPLVFLVTDSRGRPVEGARVVFSVDQAGPGAGVVPDTARTDAEGNARAQFQLGTTIGDQVGKAIVLMREGSQQPTTTFTAKGLSETANGMAAFSGDGQSGPAGSSLEQPLVVQVTDVFGNPIAGVSITWAVEGGGSVSEASNTTDGQGQASVSRTLGPAAGPQATVATSEGLAGSPVTFAHMATAGNASLLTIVSGNDQTAVAGSELPADLVVRLVDAQGNGVSGAAVTWVVGTGGGSVAPENTTTDEAGRTSSRWTLGPAPGENRADAVVSGVGVVHFQAIGTSAAPSRLAIVTQPSSSSRNAARLERQPVVQVRDAGGNDVRTPGIEITAQLAGGGGELLGTRQLRTDANGRVAFSNLAIAGAQGPRTLVFTAIGYAGATSSPIDIQPIPTTTTITGDTPDPSAAGALVTVSFRVAAAGITPLGSVTITDGNQTCTGTLSNATGSCQLPLNTAGERTLRATYAGSAGLNGSSDTETHQVQAPPAPNNPPDARFTWTCDGLTCRFTDTSTDRDGSVVAWSWSFGDQGTSNERSPTHSFPAAGTYTVTLTISDDDGAGDQASDQVKVNAPPPPQPNKAPHADFEVACANPDLTCSFTDRSRDDDGSIMAWHWDFGDGQTADVQNPSHTYGAAQKYQVILTVTDDDGTSASKTQDANPKAPPPPPANKAPTAEFEVACPNLDLTCSFTDRSRDDDGSITAWHWDFGDGQTADVQNPSHAYAAAQKYQVTLTVTDDDGSSASKTHDANPKAPAPPPNQPPTAAFSAPSCTTGEACQFTDASTDSDGTVTEWEWDFDDSGAKSTEQNPPHTYSASGTYTVKLRVRDNDGAQSDEVQHEVTVTDPAPPPNTAPNARIGSISCNGTDCAFTDDSTDLDGNATIAQWSWNFGDGESSDLRNPVHIYAVPGDYTVTLTVTDDHQASATDLQNITLGTTGG